MKNSFILFCSYALFKFIVAVNVSLRFFPEVAFLDVGQGDAILITTPGRSYILVDGGSGYTVSSHLNDYFPLNNCLLDAVFLTHPHADHMEGLVRILRHCRVRRVFYTSVEYESGLYEEWEHLAAPPLGRPFLAGDAFFPDGSVSEGLVSDEMPVLRAIWPPEDYIGKALSNVNNASTVMFYDVGDFEVFLTGDAEVEVLRKFVSMDFPFLEGSLEVYKASHHGARNGSIPQLWSKLNPLLAVILVGDDNKFGHPHEEVINWLEESGVLYKRSDIDGTVKIRYNLP